MKQLQIQGATDYVELSLLGADGSLDPSVDTFPTQFNANGRKVWVELMKSDKFLDAKKRAKTRDELWTWCIRAYLRYCGYAGVFPFSSPTVQSNNDTVIEFLRTARRRAIAYLDQTEMFRKVKLTTIHREYTIQADSVKIVTCGHLMPLNDPTFRDWLQVHSPAPQFKGLGRAGTYGREVFNNLDSRVEFEFNLVNMVRPLLKMTVACGTPVAYSRNLAAPTLPQLQHFVENIIWLPLVRAHRFKYVSNRLF